MPGGTPPSIQCNVQLKSEYVAVAPLPLHCILFTGVQPNQAMCAMCSPGAPPMPLRPLSILPCLPSHCLPSMPLSAASIQFRTSAVHRSWFGVRRCELCDGSVASGSKMDHVELCPGAWAPFL
jgi:hypothetical protein